MKLNEILGETYNKFENVGDIADMSLDMQFLKSKQKDVENVRGSLYSLVNDNFVRQKKELVYGENEEPVPKETIKFSLKFWEWHKIGQERIAKNVDRSKIKEKVVKEYYMPENSRDILPLVFQGINKHKTTLVKYTEEINKFNQKVDTIINDFSQASAYHIDRIGNIVIAKQEAIEYHKELVAKKEDLQEKLQDEGYNSQYINKIDMIDLECQKMAGEILRGEKSLKRSTIYHDSYKILAQSYDTSRTISRTVTDYIADVKDVMVTLSKGTLEVDEFMDKVFLALDTSREAEMYGNQMLSYVSGAFREVKEMGMTDYSNPKRQITASKSIESSNNCIVDKMPDSMSSIDSISSDVVGQYTKAD